jgi:hypothetical protein
MRLTVLLLIVVLFVCVYFQESSAQECKNEKKDSFCEKKATDKKCKKKKFEKKCHKTCSKCTPEPEPQVDPVPEPQVDPVPEPQVDPVPVPLVEPVPEPQIAVLPPPITAVLPPAPVQCLHTDTDCGGSDYWNGVLGDRTECINKCKEDSGCQSVAWDSRNVLFFGPANRCWMKNAQPGLKSLGGVDCWLKNDNCEEIAYNLAKGKSAVQKSIGWGGDPNRAIDGNTDSNYGGNSCTHTQSSDHSWWSVDLGVPSKVESVKIYNRQDCCSDRLTDPIVYLSNEQPSEGQDLNTGAYTECGRFNGQVGESVNLGCMPSGDAFRYVIVTIDNTNFLTLCEVEVMGVPA